MAKNDWQAGDFINRTAANQPYWLASGTIGGGGDGANDLRVFVAPGSIRYPWLPQIVYSGQVQSVIVSTATAARYYTFFIRSSGAFVISGSTTSTIPGPPFYDAEPIGTVYTGASLSTANLLGPWNTQGGPYEQRGQMTAVQSAVPRVISADTGVNSEPYPCIGVAVASGLLFISHAPSTSTHLQAMVVWSVSGNTNEQLNANFTLARQFAGPGSVGAIAKQTCLLTAPSDPYNINTVKPLLTTYLQCIYPNQFSNVRRDFCLRYDAGTGTAGTPSILIHQATLVGITGYFAQGANEQ